MNKKIYVGMMSLGVAATFWACGSGDIITPNNIDEVLKGYVAEEPTVGLNMVTEKECPACFEGAVASSSSKKVRSSSSSQQNPNQQDQSSSSSKIEVNTSSSSARPPSEYSSSAYRPPVSNSSSSSQSMPEGTIGVCAPTKDISEIDEGGKVTWKFTQNKEVIKDATMLLSASFNWTFEGATPSSATAKGAGGMSQSVTYSTSGDHGATLVVSIGNSPYQLTCSPVHVNGAKITGCKCSATDKKPDISVGASWSVAGCTSAGANIVGYEWTGATVADPAHPEKAAAALTEKGQTVAPVVRVSNDDNSVTDVQCEEVTAVDALSPDYEILQTSNTGAIPIPAGTNPVHIKVPFSGQSCVVFCQTTWDAETQGQLDMEVGGKKKSGAFNVTVDLSPDNCDDDMVEFTLSAPATCGVQ